jgi:chromosome partitioning protein
MHVVALANQKGGVGKTTTAINLGAALAARGERVLIVDMDPQANATVGLGFDSSQRTTIYEVLSGLSPISRAVQPTLSQRLSLVPSSLDLAGLEVELASANRREYALADALVKGRLDADFILIDSPPSLGLLTINSLVAAERVIIPVQCEFLPLTGLVRLRQTIARIASTFKPGLDLVGVVLTMYDARTRLARDVEAEVRNNFGGHVFATVIPRSVRLAEAPSYGAVISDYAEDSTGAEAYKRLAAEVLALAKGW